MLYTGIRIGELINLRISDVNLKTKEILVREGKGNKDRVVPIYYKLISILKMYLTECERLKKQSEFFFVAYNTNEGLSYKAVYRMIQKIKKETGIDFSPHRLRHTFASEALDNGLDIYKVGQILGHKSPVTTTIYLSLSPSSLKKSLDKVDIF